MKLFHLYIPCYNEEENILPLLDQCLQLHYHLNSRGIRLQIFPINDGSRDKTSVLIDQADQQHECICALHHVQNKGLAGALETAFEHTQAAANNPDFLGMGLLDGDNSHNPMTFLPMIDTLMQGYEVVVASRYQTGSQMMGLAWYRQMLSWGMSLLFRLFGRMENIRDYSCGFRAYSRSIVQRLGAVQLTYRSFACMVELLCHCHRAGATMREVPFCLRYDLKKGASKMQFGRTIKETMKVLLSK